jgi:hypothetical protein
LRRAALLLLLALLAVPAAAHDGPRAHHFLMTQVEILESVLYIDVWVERPTPEVAAEFRSMFEHDPTRAEEQDEAFRRANFDRMIAAMTVELDGEELALQWRPGPLVNNGQGNDEFFTWAIVAEAPVPESRRALDLRIHNTLFEDAHVFLSCYVKLDGGWKVEFDSARATLEASEEAVRADRAGVSWTHDPSVRNWEIRLRR